MDRVYTKEEIQNRLFPIFNEYSIDKAILFGSYAKGNSMHLSDVDILIDSKGRIKGIDFFGVLEDITEALGVPVDLIEASQVLNGSRAQVEIANTGVVIYERT